MTAAAATCCAARAGASDGGVRARRSAIDRRARRADGTQSARRLGLATSRSDQPRSGAGVLGTWRTWRSRAHPHCDATYATAVLVAWSDPVQRHLYSHAVVNYYATVEDPCGS